MFFLNPRILILASLTALAPFAIDTYLPAFEVMEDDLATNSNFIQQTLTFYLVPYTIMTIFHGAISDSIGRIKTIKYGMSLFILGSIGCVFATSIEILWISRLIQGVGAGAGNVVARAMVRDLYSGATAQKVMATVQIIFGIAPAIAPMVGGLLLGISWQAIFIFLIIYSVLITIFSVNFLPETISKQNRLPFNFESVLSRYKDLLIDKNYIFLILSVSFNFSAFFLYVLSSPIFLMQHLNLSSSQFGYLFIPTVTGMILGSFISKKTAGIISPAKMLKIAYLWMLLITSINLIFCLFFPSIIFINIGLIALYNIGMAAAMPLISIKALDCFPKARGTAASGQAFSQMLVSSVVAGLVIPIIWGSLATLAIGMLVIFSLGLITITKTQAWKDQELLLDE
ncbi:multidrug transporter CflA [Methylophilales bacterium MBRSG12]|uniref:Bcr/CflA family efflux transporter n=1 Tax=Methylophilales bacterium MBRS-H7 TaxID=1623450 RepID=A0A0H4J0J4_9PROT|nr:multidrug transporter CflA [Methylophilales bacterium MBRSF5]AKO65298.1 multidrug transporter CflA [Methylophilales bacterium MBRS-H7]AKO66617.1 multidrug transporter CflA [Methylophilales bacterium MBRSG12]